MSFGLCSNRIFRTKIENRRTDLLIMQLIMAERNSLSNIMHYPLAKQSSIRFGPAIEREESSDTAMWSIGK